MRGSFSSVKELIAKIEQLTKPYSRNKAPFNLTGRLYALAQSLPKLFSNVLFLPANPSFVNLRFLCFIFLSWLIFESCTRYLR
jgi:hypothetical protein